MLQLFYFCYYIAVGIALPFFPPYLRHLGLSGREISAMLSMAPLLHLFAPLVWGWVADRKRRPDLVLRVTCGGAFFVIGPLIVLRTMPGMVVLYFFHQVFAVAITGLADSLAVERARSGTDYGRIRLWGSLSFVLACAVVGPLLGARDPRGGDVLVPILLVGGFGLTFLASFGLRGHGGREAPHMHDVKALLRDRRFRLIVVMASLHWACLAPYHTFFSIMLQDRGMSSGVVGAAFVVGVIAEIAAFYLFRHIRTRIAPAPLLVVCFAATVARWCLVAAVPSAQGQIALQLVHGLTYGLFWSTALAWVGECVPQRIRATGQALFTTATFGVGNLVGVLMSGWLYDTFHGAGAAFLAAGFLEIVPLTLAVTVGRRLCPVTHDALPPAPPLPESL